MRSTIFSKLIATEKLFLLLLEIFARVCHIRCGIDDAMKGREKDRILAGCAGTIHAR